MRTSLAFALCTVLVGCSSTANVTIPPGEQFVLGEYEDGTFRVELTNQSERKVRVEARTDTGAVTQRVDLAAGGNATLYVAGGERVVVQNANPGDVTVRAVLSEDVAGMRYEPVDAAQG